MNKVNKLYFNRVDFDSETTRYIKIATQLQLLIETNNVAMIYSADPQRNTIVIEYSSRIETDETILPYWLYADEADFVKTYHDIIDYSQCKQREEELEKIYHNEITNLNCGEDIESVVKDKIKKKKGGGNYDA